MRRLRIRDFLLPGETCHHASREVTAEQPVRRHTHDFLEVFWIESGRGIHRLNGAMQRLSAGTLVLIRPSDAHAFHCEKGQPFRVTNIAFPQRAWVAMRARYFPRRKELWDAPPAARQRVLSPSAMTDLRQLAEELASGRRDPAALDRFLLNLRHLLASCEAQANVVMLPEWLSRARREILKNRNFAGGARTFAKLAGRSAEHVARETRRLLGKTPTEIVNDARMTHAAARLAQSSDKITDVALDCGFVNLSHFYRIFRRRFGLTPHAYRARTQWSLRPPEAGAPPPNRATTPTRERLTVRTRHRANSLENCGRV
ncbi:MAG: AraC family transcriptional regulator [Verrucomicrobiae bacterium]|nr:AraC family transcriptional regulator [Verrucomicrobiae bacterium]